MSSWKWIAIAAVLMIDAVWSYASGIAVEVKWLFFALTFAIVAVCYAYAKVRGIGGIPELAVCAAQLIAFSPAITVLMYLAATLNLPLIDRHLAAADNLLGFDWLAVFEWIKRGGFDGPLNAAYESVLPQVFVVLIVLNLIGRLDRVHEFVSLYFMIALITVPMSAILPAASAWVHFGVTDRVDPYHLEHFSGLRSGAIKTIILADADGLITFPSFHTALAVMYVYAMRGIRWLFPITLAANLFMLMSIPTEGGHYLIDMIAGAAITFGCILLLRLNRTAPSHERRTDRVPVGAAGNS